ncbi:hypothetical protein AWB81_06349 [Caballeronia arationis]|uniref:Uncharacterized protein n=1 Tax=Caballeronia arationis TaxID=1777142 RepID=A0A7Z7I357_9BURK|nr:hypothetical protein AWB81_06349 [Caballeronia arationis]SOE57191.1 hypothetical protein SAMN05446927_1400 [Caballeronia arationis]
MPIATTIAGCFLVILCDILPFVRLCGSLRPTNKMV